MTTKEEKNRNCLCIIKTQIGIVSDSADSPKVSHHIRSKAQMKKILCGKKKKKKNFHYSRRLTNKDIENDVL